MDLETFTQAYIEAALWSSTDESDDGGGEPLDKNYSADDLSPDIKESMRADCAAFILANEGDLILYSELIHPNEYSPAMRAGHDFWLTRNGHGAGFWDRGLGAVGDRLSDASRIFGSFDLYVGDDGKVHGGKWTAPITYLDPATVEATRQTDRPSGYRGRSDGYGSRIPSSWMLRIGKRWHRVYVVCWSNSGSAYVRTKDGNRWLGTYDPAKGAR